VGVIASVELVEPLAAEREAQHRTFELYKAAALTDERADHAIMNLYRQNVIGVQRIPDILGQWENPAFDWGERTAWRLFIATTHVLAGRVAENPVITRQLHQVIDGRVPAPQLATKRPHSGGRSFL